MACDEEPTRVALRHAPSGVVLSAGDGPALLFPSVKEASAFSARFLDEPAGWQAIPASQAKDAPKAA
jgi:hypothetical protein